MDDTVTGPDPSAATALALLVPGYHRLGHDARRAARIGHAAGLGDGLRRDLLERADAVGVPISPDERQELQGRCRDGGRARLWRCPVPLTLLDTVYDPVGQVMPPTAAGGVVLWLRPSLEVRYLHSLADLWAVLSPPGTRATESGLVRAVAVALAWVGGGWRDRSRVGTTVDAA